VAACDEMDLLFFRFGFNLRSIVAVGSVGRKMNTDSIYAGFLISAANLYASSRATACKESESRFEQKLMRLFEEAAKSGVEKQDIAVIASTAIAVVLTKASEIQNASKPFKQNHIRIVRSA